MINTGFSEITKTRADYTGSNPWYLEVAITGDCNFSCMYCNRFKADLDIEKFAAFLSSVDTLHHIQITGGEPTVHPDFVRIVDLCRKHTDILGLSTNGSAPLDFYKSLPIDKYSISFDDNDADILRKRGYTDPDHIRDVIRELSKIKYVNIGMVIDSLNIDRAEEIVLYILSLGVSDIKLSVSSIQPDVMPIFSRSYKQYPILNYRVENFKSGKPMRGFPASKCGMMKTDVTIVGSKHYPCLVYSREHGAAIGDVGPDMMQERVEWAVGKDCKNDPICSKFCMDFKCNFNAEIERRNG